jgi:diaminohydroxyphosphoribosylaminopyrimidine deaminase/5-amino-6-(5-phosphoribosylamino)uracil reductase
MKSLRNSELDAAVIDWPVHMQRALDLARHVITATPNPRVGCVLVKDNEVVGEGWHQGPGLPHAEVVALEQAGAAALGATAFVSLEPCAHHGRTGPCCEALHTAGVERVVLAIVDPNPQVAGKGIAYLEGNGIEVFLLTDFANQARAINPGFMRRMETGLPFVRLKLAMSLDGRTALANGKSKWITGASARSDVQLLRAGSSAVLTGIGTVLADDPQLNVRVEDLDISETQRLTNEANLAIQPLRVVLDSQLQTPDTSKIVTTGGRVVIYGASGEVAGRKGLAANVELLAVDCPDGRVDLRSVLNSLATDFACNEILVEAGPTLSGAFLDAGLVDELIIYMAPKIFGADARPLFGSTGLQSLAEARQFTIKDVMEVGEDLRLILSPQIKN